MNPVDHPMAVAKVALRAAASLRPPWGKPAQGYRTRNNKRTDKFIIRGRRRGPQAAGKGER